MTTKKFLEDRGAEIIAQNVPVTVRQYFFQKLTNDMMFLHLEPNWVYEKRHIMYAYEVTAEIVFKFKGYTFYLHKDIRDNKKYTVSEAQSGATMFGKSVVSSNEAVDYAILQLNHYYKKMPHYIESCKYTWVENYYTLPATMLNAINIL